MSNQTLTKQDYNANYRAIRKAQTLQYVEVNKATTDAMRARQEKPNARGGYTIGFSKFRLLKNGKIVKLPPEFGVILSACEDFIDNPRRFPSLYNPMGGMNNVQCRILTSRVLACLLVNTDMVEGRIGIPTADGYQPISYHEIQNEYALRFGAYVSTRSLAKAVKYLRRAGFLSSQRITVGDGIEVRSAAAYKQFTAKFFKELNVLTFSNIADLVTATRKRMMEKGFRFCWVPFRQLASKIMRTANLRNSVEMAGECAYQFVSNQHPTPH